MKKRDFTLIAAIDIGSNYIRMCIAEAFEDKTINIIENLIKSTNIGRDTFSKGRISAETISDTCETLRGFSEMLKEYKVKNYIAVSTTGIREAENQDYVLEQIRVKAGIEIEVINNAQEKFFMHKALTLRTICLDYLGAKPTIIVNITSGGVDASIYDKGTLKYTEYIKIGSLRLREQLSELESVTFDFPELMKEFIESKIHFLKEKVKNINFEFFIGLGGELSTIYSLCYPEKLDKSENLFIEKDKLEILYNQLIKMSSDQIIEQFGITKKQEEILLPSIIFFKVFLEYIQAKAIYYPGISLKHGLLAYIADKIYKRLNSEESLKDIINYTWYIVSKFAADANHAEFVKKTALTIFDQTLKVHKLGKRERLYLEVASILHDIGKYVSYSEHDLHSYNIIKTQNIMGFSDEELEVISNIVRYHEGNIPNKSDDNYYCMDLRRRIIVSKLTAILQLSEALDVSHKQKISNIEIHASGDKLFFIPHTKYNILLEQWHFEDNVNYFEETMGVKPIIEIKG